MNPFKRFRNYIIGDALSRTDDVFERARIELAYSYFSILLIMGLLYSGNIIANHITWQMYLMLFAIPSMVAMLVILKKTKNVKYAGYYFIFFQVIMHLANGFANKFQPRMDGNFWSLMGIIFIFFVLGKKWGLVFTLFFVVTMILGPVDEMTGGKILNYQIPREQIVPQNAFSTLIPLAIIIYSLVQILSTRTAAEKIINEQKKTLATSCKELEVKNEDIVSSINYAKRIQHAVLPQEETIYRNIPLSFILYRPRDIVSGDFFWFHEIDRDNYIIACADCTGHGVPGAMMTVIGSNLLNQIVIDNKITEPSKILLVLDNFINQTLKQQKEHEHFVQDGMDLALLKVDKKNREFIFSSAKRPAIFVRNKQMQEFKGSKHTLGGMITGCKVFNETKMTYQEDDIIYFYTDGYTDQFGGPKGKKFSSKQLKETLMGIHKLQMAEQKNRLNTTLAGWMADQEQVDDVLVMGIKF